MNDKEKGQETILNIYLLYLLLQWSLNADSGSYLICKEVDHMPFVYFYFLS